MATNDILLPNSSTAGLAAAIAVLLDRDPVMAGQVKEYLSESRLLEVLSLPELTESATELEKYKALCGSIRKSRVWFDEALDKAGL